MNTLPDTGLTTGLANEDELTRRSYYLATTPAMEAFGPLAGSEAADVCVVGGGLAGLSAAIELRAKGYSVVLLEGQRLGWGASGRNGGQAIVGHSSDDAIIAQFSKEDAKRAWDVTVEGMHLMRERIATHTIDCDYIPGWMYLAVNARKAKSLRESFEFTRDTFGFDQWSWVDHADIGQYIASPRFHSGVYDTLSGHLHPLKFTLGLARVARDAGVRIHERSRAIRLQRGAAPVVKTDKGEVRCKFVVLAGNCYLGELVPELNSRIMPVGTYVVATNPLDPALAESLIKNRAAICDNNFVLDYFRVSPDHRVVFGGRVSYSTMTPVNLDVSMLERILTVFPQLAGRVQVEYSWGGFVDITMNRAPDFGRLTDNIYYLQGFSGHGLALTGIAGKIAAEAIAGQAERFDLYTRIKHLPFPGGKLLRTPALVAGMLWYRLRDML
jgi:gamma-glutamylputrescine oxidase